MSAFEEARVIGKCIHCGVGVYLSPMIKLYVGSHFSVEDIPVHVAGHERCEGPDGYLDSVAEVRKLRSISEGKESA